MEIINRSDKSYILRLDYGEELREQLEKLCEGNNIKSAWFNAIGATKDAELAVYNLEEKKYDTKQFSEMMEIVSVIGNISMREGKQFMHAHGVFARPSFEAIGGHIMKCVISATCEISLWKAEGAMGRKYNEFTGLHLLCAEST